VTGLGSLPKGGTFPMGTLRNKMQPTEQNTTQTLRVPENKGSEDTDASLTATSGQHQENFLKAALTSMNTIDASVELLHEQTKSLLKSSEFQKPTITEVEIALRAANTIATLIQTKVNFVKVLKG
jgi:hypothetical protein